MSMATRRDLLKWSVLLPALSAAGRTKPGRIRDVLLDLDKLSKWDDSNGDSWDPFWADDGQLYAFHCDGRGFGKASRNLAFNCLSGDSPEALSGGIVNTMDEYGVANKKEADNATWKACGQECIDGVFYAFVSRNAYGSDSGDYWLRQTAFNSSLIKSTDRGRTWTRSAAENYRDPMWPGPLFGAPFFIHYGRNGGAVAQDGADRYVYAVSTNGFWNDGDRYILGRVPRAKLPDLNASDWAYFTGGDGSAAKNWSPRIRDAKPVLEQRVHCGQSGPCYIPALGAYLMVVWYNTERMAKWFEPNEMKYDFYQSAHPWGPWTFVHSYSDRFLSAGHMYGPSLCAKFQRVEGGDVRVTMFTSGCPFEDVPGGLYKAWQIPLILKTGPIPRAARVEAGDTRIVNGGQWAELQFHGTAVDYVADKDAAFGAVEVFVDGAPARTVSLAIRNFPRLPGVTVFRSGALGKGAHTIRIVSRTAAPLNLDSFQIYE